MKKGSLTQKRLMDEGSLGRGNLWGGSFWRRDVFNEGSIGIKKSLQKGKFWTTEVLKKAFF